MGGMGRRFNLTLSEQSEQAKQRHRAIIHKPVCAFASIGDEFAWTYVYLVHKFIQYMIFGISFHQNFTSNIFILITFHLNFILHFLYME